MANRNSRNKSDRLLACDIVLLNAHIDHAPSQVSECIVQNTIQYNAPTFSAYALIKVPPLKEKKRYKCGFIQACTKMESYNFYGMEGCSSWEIPHLKYYDNCGSSISDSDGRVLPWYGNTTEVVLIEGPTQCETYHQIKMIDRLHSSISLNAPNHKIRSKLTGSYRNQRFYTWLVVTDEHQSPCSAQVYKTIEWGINITIFVDHENKGTRFKLIESSIEEQPVILPINIPVPISCFTGPEANSSQMLIWKSNNAIKKQILIPPKKHYLLKSRLIY